MTIVKAIFSHFLAFLMAFFVTLVPYKGVKAPVLDTLKDDCRLNVEMISDTHTQANEPLRIGFVKWGLKNISRSKAPVDSVIVMGDITTYADEPSVSQFFDVVKKCSPVELIAVSGNHDIGHAGDRNVTDISREEARDNFIRYRNEYMGRNDDKIYFSTEVNGYKFIVLGDEVIDGGHWDGITMSDEQLDFLDRELADGTKDGKPVFVLNHWPIEGTTSESTVWPECGIERDRYDVAAILEKYNNVFWFSGHMHAGIRADAVENQFDLPWAEQINGVTYINLPTYGLVNMFGIPWSGTGAQMEVYDDEVVLRPVNYLTNNWYENAERHFKIN